MRKLLLILSLCALACCLFALSVSAASTNEFGALDTSDKIDLTGMSTDTKARVVLFDGTEYHTYPAQYIVTSANELAVNFEKINVAFTKEYKVDSVIRIEIPNTVKVIGSIFNYGKNNNLKEVFFPADSTVYKLNWGCFENNTGLEKINIPASLTEYNGQNHFAKCSSLKEITFDEGYSVSYIPLNFLQSCSSLEKIVFPNCVTEVRGGAFSSCAKLKTVVFGSSLQTMLGSMSDCATSGSVWYLPASFYAPSVESEPPSNMFHWAGGQTNNVSGTNNNPKNITFVYTGTKAQAEALQARFKAADAATGENCIGLNRIYDAILCTEAEYEQLTGKKVGEVGAKGYYLVYGYGVCDAFYNGSHVMKGEETVTVKSYFEAITVGDVCTREGCGNTVITKTIDPIFTDCGYSFTEEAINGSYSMSQFYKINNEALEAYLAETNSSFEYGLLVSTVDNPLSEENEELIELGKTYIAESKFVAFEYFGIGIKGITTDDQKGVALTFCAYVNDNGKIFYLNGGETEAVATMKSFNDLTN